MDVLSIRWLLLHSCLHHPFLFQTFLLIVLVEKYKSWFSPVTSVKFSKSLIETGFCSFVPRMPLVPQDHSLYRAEAWQNLLIWNLLFCLAIAKTTTIFETDSLLRRFQSSARAGQENYQRVLPALKVGRWGSDSYVYYAYRYQVLIWSLYYGVRHILLSGFSLQQ